MALTPLVQIDDYGDFNEIFPVDQPTGDSDAGRIVAVGENNYIDPALLNATTTSTGNASAGQLGQLGPNGRFSESMMPLGVTADAKTLPATETIPAGSVVNTFDLNGVIHMQLADGPSGKRAHGFVVAGVPQNGSGLAYFEGTNPAVAGLHDGDELFLGSGGQVTNVTPIAGILQKVGVALSATEFSFHRGPVVRRAAS